ncbi:MAG TPA: hypothetical protein VMV16_08995 [Solirubrobacteraceae bacterium]|nr:hypothetical protein [Solirubrobacteraceae bacterium]
MGTRRIAPFSVIAASLVVAGCGSSRGTAPPASSAARYNKLTISGFVRSDTPTVRRGAKVHAELVLHNSSDRTRVLARGCPHGFVQLMLSSRTLTVSPAWALPACSDATFVARPGTTTYPLEVPATYLACTMRGHQSQAGSIQCLPGNRMPPLPAGTYAVSVVASSIQLQHELAHVRSTHVRILR